MKSLKKAVLVIIAVVLVLAGAVGVLALSTADRIRAKFKRVQAAVTILARKQVPMDGIVQSIGQVKKALDAGDAATAESILDGILVRKEVVDLKEAVDREPAVSNKFNPPPQAANEAVTNIFSVPQLVEVVGYNDHAMEPCITPDGKFLMFNNSNDAAATTHINVCKRLDKNKFQHLGLLPGTVSGSKDMAPSVDLAGNIYFTSLRSYDRDMKSLYVGRFDGAKVENVRAVAGDVTPKVRTWINMDCCVSADGKTLVSSRARFDIGATVPAESDLHLFVESNNSFAPHPQSSALMKAINTPALEYAPSLSTNLLELYFTRAQITPGKGGGPLLRIMLARRSDTSQPFGPPMVIGSISGFVEAPTLPASGQELFFHKMDGGRFKIFRCDRVH